MLEWLEIWGCKEGNRTRFHMTTQKEECYIAFPNGSFHYINVRFFSFLLCKVFVIFLFGFSGAGEQKIFLYFSPSAFLQ